MKYSVIGTGAVGGFYGAKLANAGFDVEFLLHSDYHFVKENGLKVLSCDGDFFLKNPKVFSSTAEMSKSDVVLVGLKSVNQELLYKILPPLLKENTLVILIQNGIGLEEDLQQKFPGLNIAAGLAFICSQKILPGIIEHLFYGSINLGNFSCKDKALFDSVLNDFLKAGVQAQEVEYYQARWKKAVWNMPFNGMTVVLKTTTDNLLKNPYTEKLIYDQMKEVIDAAQTLGVKGLDYSFADKMIEMTKAMIPYSPSMKLDYDFKRPMETYYLYTRPVAEALKAGFEMKKLAMLEAQLRFLG